MYKDDLEAQIAQNQKLERENADLRAKLEGKPGKIKVIVTAMKEWREKRKEAKKYKRLLAKPWYKTGQFILVLLVAGAMALIYGLSSAYVACDNWSMRSNQKWAHFKKMQKIRDEVCKEACTKAHGDNLVDHIRSTIYCWDNCEDLRGVKCQCVAVGSEPSVRVVKPSRKLWLEHKKHAQIHNKLDM